MPQLLRFFSLISTLLLLVHSAQSQIIQDPTTWNYEVKKTGSDQYELVFDLKLKDGWHIYAMEPGGDGTAIPPSFDFHTTSDYALIGDIREEGTIVQQTIEDIGTFNYYKTHVNFIQTVQTDDGLTITGEHEYQVCDDKMCLPPKTKKFAFQIPGSTKAPAPVEESVAVEPLPEEDTTTVSIIAPELITADSLLNKETSVPADTLEQQERSDDQTSGSGGNRGLLWLFLMSLGGGIAAVITPCVYSMIPITVSFFTKRSKTRSEGIKNAIWYSLSIILIFTILGVLIAITFGANALNNLSTNWIANLFFFLIFIIFGISFLGAFEITLPASWTSKTDAKAGISSFGGIFFMALTLVIVSFSCTGPIVGPLLVVASSGGVLGPMIGMFAFSVGLAMPFAIFAVFPGLLNKMATSGGWLNQVKVVLGFLELMLALKFLSNADLARGWRLLDREVFIAIWIVLAVLLGLYLLGKLKLSHDDAPAKNIYGQEYVSIFKLFLAIASFSFAVYLVPGMWGAPLNGMSQFLPPMGTQDFVMGRNHTSSAASAHQPFPQDIAPKKYVEDMKIYEPPVVVQSGLVTYFDYDEALAAAKVLKKPVMLDFTGITCVNCRKMESQVWSQPDVMKRLKEDFIIASLYSDYDKVSLPVNEQFFSDILQSQVITVGDWNEHLQASKFNSNSQPFYYFVDENGEKLIEKGYSYDPNPRKFIAHLDQVLANYRQKTLAKK